MEVVSQPHFNLDAQVVNKPLVLVDMGTGLAPIKALLRQVIGYSHAENRER